MLSLEDARILLERALPESKAELAISYKDLYVFQVLIQRPSETGFDPFYSVNQETGEVKEFSIITDGDILDINALFMAAKLRNNRRK